MAPAARSGLRGAIEIMARGRGAALGPEVVLQGLAEWRRGYIHHGRHAAPPAPRLVAWRHIHALTGTLWHFADTDTALTRPAVPHRTLPWVLRTLALPSQALKCHRKHSLGRVGHSTSLTRLTVPRDNTALPSQAGKCHKKHCLEPHELGTVLPSLTVPHETPTALTSQKTLLEASQHCHVTVPGCHETTQEVALKISTLHTLAMPRHDRH